MTKNLSLEILSSRISCMNRHLLTQSRSFFHKGCPSGKVLFLKVFIPKMTQISNCLQSPKFPAVTMSHCCQQGERMVAEKCGHRSTKTINIFLCYTSSATNKSPHAIPGNIKDSNSREEWHINSVVAQIILFCFLKRDAVSAILQLNDSNLIKSLIEFLHLHMLSVSFY